MLAAAKYIGAGLACSGLIGAGAGIGLIFSSLIASTARNPQIRGQLFFFAILGFALAEATGLFSLMIAFFYYYTHNIKKNKLIINLIEKYNKFN